MSVHLSTLRDQYEVDCKNENVLQVKVCYFKKSCLANCEFLKMGGTSIQMDFLHVMLNILSISLLSRVNGTSDFFRMQKLKSSHVILSFEENQ